MMTSSTGISLSDTDFRQIVEIAAAEAGLAIPEAKRSLVQSRIARRMRSLGLTSCQAYLDSLAGNRDETENLICALTTNVSHFFRENHHFEYVRDRILHAQYLTKLRFWSAGCSNGQEAYSLAIEILKAMPDAARRDIRILATDIDGNVLKKAASGQYSAQEIEGVSKSDRVDFFIEEQPNQFQICAKARELVHFKHLNLNGSNWPMKGPFDAIFCRNVVIYFSDETQSMLWPRFRALLPKGGHLMLGHSERIHPLEGSGFETAGVTTYRKI